MTFSLRGPLFFKMLPQVIPNPSEKSDMYHYQTNNHSEQITHRPMLQIKPEVTKIGNSNVVSRKSLSFFFKASKFRNEMLIQSSRNAGFSNVVYTITKQRNFYMNSA